MIWLNKSTLSGNKLKQNLTLYNNIVKGEAQDDMKWGESIWNSEKNNVNTEIAKLAPMPSI